MDENNGARVFGCILMVVVIVVVIIWMWQSFNAKVVAPFQQMGGN